MFDDMCNVENRTVIVGYSGLAGEEKMSARAASCLWLTEITSIAMCSQIHVTGVVGEHCFFLGDDVVEIFFV